MTKILNAFDFSVIVLAVLSIKSHSTPADVMIASGAIAAAFLAAALESFLESKTA
jgi:hypothetical protein